MEHEAVFASPASARAASLPGPTTGARWVASADHFQTVHQDYLAADVALGFAVAAAVVTTVLVVIKPSAPKHATAFRPRSGVGFAF